MSTTTPSSDTPANDSATPTDRFLQFFRGYGISLGLIVSATPAATQYFDVLPVYTDSKSVLALFATLASLLSVAIVFLSRHTIGDTVFPPQRVISSTQLLDRQRAMVFRPCFFAILAMVGFIVFIAATQGSIDAVVTGKHFNNVDSKKALSETASKDIPYFWIILAGYCVGYSGSVFTFVWLGIIEFMQKSKGISDQDLHRDPYRLAKDIDYPITGVHDTGKDPVGVFCRVEYDPDASDARVVSDPIGPFCERHYRRLVFRGMPNANQSAWKCRRNEEKKDSTDHEVVLDVNPYTLDEIILRKGLQTIEGKIKMTRRMNDEVDNSR